MVHIPAGRMEHTFTMRTSPCVPRQYHQTLCKHQNRKTIVSKAVTATSLTSPSVARSDGAVVDSLGDDTTHNFPQIGPMPDTKQRTTAAYQLPPDVAVALNRLITRVSVATYMPCAVDCTLAVTNIRKVHEVCSVHAWCLWEPVPCLSHRHLLKHQRQPGSA